MILTVTLNPCIDKSSCCLKIKTRKQSPLQGGSGEWTRRWRYQCKQGPAKTRNSFCGLVPRRRAQREYALFLTAGSTYCFPRSGYRWKQGKTGWCWKTVPITSTVLHFPAVPYRKKPSSQWFDQSKVLRLHFVIASGSLPPDCLIIFTAHCEKRKIGWARCIVDTSGPALQALKAGCLSHQTQYWRTVQNAGYRMAG